MTETRASHAELTMCDVVAGYYSNDLVLNGVSLTAFSNKVTVVLGPNGSGKSTAMRVLYGILVPRGGQVMLDKTDITNIPPYQRLKLGIAFLPQGRSIFPELTVHDNLQIGGWVLQDDRKRFRKHVDAMYERYPLLKDLRYKPAGSLSGGQQRILEIARMMVADPQIILIDEPSAGLAPLLVDQIYEEIAGLKEEKRTILLVDQNVRPAVALADYIYILQFGRNHIQGGRADFEGKLTSIIKSWLRI